MAKRTTKREGDVCDIKITLKGTKPPIWRRVRCRANTDLADLHDIIQRAMGWGNYHLWEFVIGGTSHPGPGLESASSRGRGLHTDLRAIADEGHKRFVYIYDMGDSWEHQVVIEKLLPAEEGVSYPVCVAGKRACPPEDCGGVWGYEELLEMIQDPDHPEHERMLEWVGGSLAPEAFNIEAVNRRLKAAC